MGLSSVERFGGSGSTSVSSGGSQSTLSTSCHSSMSTVGNMSCRCKSENLFVAPQGQRKLKLFKKIKLRMGLGK